MFDKLRLTLFTTKQKQSKKLNNSAWSFKWIVHPTKIFIAIIFSPTSCSKPVWVSFFCWTQKKTFWWTSVTRQLMDSMGKLPTFFKISYFDYNRRKEKWNIYRFGTTCGWENDNKKYFSGVRYHFKLYRVMNTSNNVIRIKNIAMTKNADKKTIFLTQCIIDYFFFEALLMKTCIVMFHMFLHIFFLLIYGPPSKMFCLFTFFNHSANLVDLHLAYMIGKKQKNKKKTRFVYKIKIKSQSFLTLPEVPCWL